MPKGNPEISKHGKKTQWKPGETGNPDGRPRKVLTQLSKKLGINFNSNFSKTEKYEILSRMLEMSLDELRGIATDKSAPAFMVVVATAIRNDIKTGKMYTLNDLFDRFFGRPDQVSKIVGKDGGPVQVEDMSTEKLSAKERAAMLKLLDKMGNE